MRTPDKVVIRFHASNMLFPSITTALSKNHGFYFEVKVTGISAAKNLLALPHLKLITSVELKGIKSLATDKRLM